ncbi:hypothetical protein [Desulfobacula phenolica]|uniref:Uncharacterized protein n=1 Tax=Desulfobacula phenolica TaxID=90732 RepID=A0A1H2DQ42_9BACT|nr:hypothetical protein [Desulfobacula phenolica]SDT84871.1 hypothetical protein SAMN04487931_101413 [Desulfobacula phenolica]
MKKITTHAQSLLKTCYAVYRLCDQFVKHEGWIQASINRTKH